MTVALIFLLSFCMSCASVSPPAGERGGATAAGEELVWPDPPLQARIRFLYSFRDGKDLEFSGSFFGFLKRVFFGERDEGMVRPYAIAVEGEWIAVADPGARVVHCFDLGERKYRRIAKAGDVAFGSPVGVALGAGRIFVADSAAGKVYGLDRKGRHVLTIEDAQRPTGLAFDPMTSMLYVADTVGSRVSAYDGNGERQFSFGTRGSGEAEFNYPTHLFLAGQTLLVNDTMNFRVQAFDLQGGRRFSFGRHGDGSGEMAQPKGVGMDSEGHVYVADALSDRVQIFDARGRFLLAFGGQGDRPGKFWLPAGLFVASDRIYVADSYNRRVQVFEFLGGGEG